MREFPVEMLRRQFPALRCAGSRVFFDNAAGARVPDRVIEAVRRHLIEHNVQRGGNRHSRWTHVFPSPHAPPRLGCGTLRSPGRRERDSS
jgi:selenocysteine lyase/cysteine desulfurase